MARGGHKADEQITFTGVAPLGVFAEGSSEEPLREGFSGASVVDSMDGVGEEGGGDGGERLAFIIVETDKQTHVLLLNNVVQDRARELKGMRHLGIQFLIIENDRRFVNAKKVTA
jgi:hypothetical protein